MLAPRSRFLPFIAQHRCGRADRAARPGVCDPRRRNRHHRRSRLRQQGARRCRTVALRSARQIRGDLRFWLGHCGRSELVDTNARRLPGYVLHVARPRLQRGRDDRLPRAHQQACHHLHAARRPGAVPLAERQKSVTATLADTILLDRCGRRTAERSRPAKASAARRAACRTCRRRRTAASASMPNRWCCCPTAASSSATSTGLTSIASLRPAVCSRRSGRRRPSFPSAMAGITSLPTIPAQVRRLRSRAIRRADGRTTRASRG